MTTISDKLSTTWSTLTDMPSNDTQSFLLMLVAALCLNEWAIIHYAAMFLLVIPAWTGDVGTGMAGVATESGIDYLAYEYPVHTNRIFIQHGINLGIAGLFSHLAIPAMLMKWEAAPVIAMVPYLVDWGYFIAFDLPHLGSVPAQAQTYIISVGLICTALYTYYTSSQGSWDMLYATPFILQGFALFSAGIVNLVVKEVAGGWGPPILADGSDDYSDAIMA